MELKIYARNIDLNRQAEEYIQKKFERLERHLRPLSDAKLEISLTSARSQDDRVVAQLTLSAKGRVLRGQKRGLNLYAALDAVTDAMDYQIRRYKGKAYRSEQARRAGKEDSAPPVEQGVAEVDDLRSPRVVRTKQFPMKPMNVEEAILEMELLSHSFFLFQNADTGTYSVVYCRQDGDYGLIEPEQA